MRRTDRIVPGTRTEPLRKRFGCRVFLALPAALWTALGGAGAPARQAKASATISIRGHEQSLRLYGLSGGDPVIVSSGDGGWVHLAPHLAELLGDMGYFVVGFDVKAYLSSFTSGSTTLRAEDEPGDYRVLVEFASRRTGKRPILIGVSEGAGLSVLAASDSETKSAIRGLVALGLPDRNELGWRWKDWIIYLTHTAAESCCFQGPPLPPPAGSRCSIA